MRNHLHEMEKECLYGRYHITIRNEKRNSRDDDL